MLIPAAGTHASQLSFKRMPAPSKSKRSFVLQDRLFSLPNVN